MNRTVLPDPIVWPKLSPSGRYVVNPEQLWTARSTRLTFYRTSDWVPVRSVVIPYHHMAANPWETDCLWINRPRATVRPPLTWAADATVGQSAFRVESVKGYFQWRYPDHPEETKRWTVDVYKAGSCLA